MIYIHDKYRIYDLQEIVFDKINTSMECIAKRNNPDLQYNFSCHIQEYSKRILAHCSQACFKRRILHASNSIVSIMYILSATSETIKFDVSNCGRPKL